MTTYKAGGGDKLGVIRHGRDLLEQHERMATGADLFPGDALMTTTDANGNEAFTHHDGANTTDYYVAVEARQRGMDAQTTTGYVADDDLCIAVRPSGGGLNVSLAAGETASEGDALVVGANGAHTVFDGAGGDVAADIVAYADEDLDLSGATDPALVGAEME